MVRYTRAYCSLFILFGANLITSFTAIERIIHRNTITNGHRRMISTKGTNTDPELLYPAYNISVPIDHFHNSTLYEPHTNSTFNLRYWFDASYYKPGGPVIILQSGETSGVG